MSPPYPQRVGHRPRSRSPAKGAPPDPPKAPRWGGPLPKSVLTPPGQDEGNFPPLATSEASRKAAEAAKKKAEEVEERRKEGCSHAFHCRGEERQHGVDEVGTSEAPTAPVAGHTPASGSQPPGPPLATPVDLGGVESFEDLLKTLDREQAIHPMMNPILQHQWRLGEASGQGGFRQRKTSRSSTRWTQMPVQRESGCFRRRIRHYPRRSVF